MEKTDKEEIRREIAESLKGEIRREVSTSLLTLLGNLEQGGILTSPEADKIEEEVAPPDPHHHMDFFPVFVLEGDRLEQVDLSQAIKRSEEEHRKHEDEHEHGSGHEHEHGSGHEHKKTSRQQRGKKGH